MHGESVGREIPSLWAVLNLFFVLLVPYYRKFCLIPYPSLLNLPR